MIQPLWGDSDAASAGGELSSFKNGRRPFCETPRLITEGTCWVGVVANRSSGTGSSRQQVRQFVHELEQVGFGSEIAWTPSERQELVSLARRDLKCRCLVAVGGDGTFSALINEQPTVPITVLPTGTENLAAQHFRLRRNPAWLARTIASGGVVRADLGSANGRRFMLMAGFGFDGDVVTRHHRSRTSRSGVVKPTHRAAYLEPIIRASLFYRFPPVRVRISDPGAEEVLQGTTVFVFNLPRYALGLPFAPAAQQDDGLLDLLVFRDPGPFQALYFLWRVLRGTHLDHPGVFHRRVRRVVLTADEAVPVQLDGDPAGYLVPTEHQPWANGLHRGPDRVAPMNGQGPHPTGDGWSIEVLPRAVDMLVPIPQLAPVSPSSARQER
jgi:diacylglycerol kinase (ATP)